MKIKLKTGGIYNTDVPPQLHNFSKQNIKEILNLYDLLKEVYKR